MIQVKRKQIIFSVGLAGMGYGENARTKRFETVTNDTNNLHLLTKCDQPSWVSQMRDLFEICYQNKADAILKHKIVKTYAWINSTNDNKRLRKIKGWPANVACKCWRGQRNLPPHTSPHLTRVSCSGRRLMNGLSSFCFGWGKFS